jgi:K+-transporting ATPase A subunit
MFAEIYTPIANSESPDERHRPDETCRGRCGTQAMDWKSYTLHMLATNLAMAIFIFPILRCFRIACR